MIYYKKVFAYGYLTKFARFNRHKLVCFQRKSVRLIESSLAQLLQRMACYVSTARISEIYFFISTTTRLNKSLCDWAQYMKNIDQYMLFNRFVVQTPCHFILWYMPIKNKTGIVWMNSTFSKDWLKNFSELIIKPSTFE